MKRICGIFIMSVLILACAFGAWCQEQKHDQAQPEQPEYAGEFFGVPVPKDNYYFVMVVVMKFSSPWGGLPSDRKQLEQRIWEELVMSYEAFRRGIQVSQEEADDEIEKTLKTYKLDFNWKEDKERFEKWVKETIGGSPVLLENQMKHLVQLNKLYQEVLNSANPEVTEEEAFQEYLNEYNSLSVELVQFDEQEKAQEFYKKSIEDPAFWEAEKNREEDRITKEKAEGKEPERSKFRRPGFVALEFLIQMWKFPRDAAFDMINKEIGSYYPPTPIYKGYGVFKILEVRKADEAEFPKRREFYFDQIRQQKKVKEFFRWLKQLKKDANIKKFIHPPEEIFKQPAQ